MVNLGRDYASEALGLQDAGEFIAAIGICSEGIQYGQENELLYGPDKVELYILRSSLYSFVENYFDAISDMTTVIDICSKHLHNRRCKLDRHYFYRGTLYFHSEAYDKAIEDFTEAIALEPQKYTQRYFHRSRARYLTGDTMGAIEDLRRVIELVDEKHDDAISARELIGKIEKGTW